MIVYASNGIEQIFLLFLSTNICFWNLCGHLILG